MGDSRRGVALITGGSRGIGAATAVALARNGFDVAITYRNKQKRALQVIEKIEEGGARGLATACDITMQADVESLFTVLACWAGGVDALVLNASGGLERDRLIADPEYPMHINRDAQVATLHAALPHLRKDGTVVFVTSHWAHRYGTMEQFPAYEPIAVSKHAGEQAIRSHQAELTERGVRLLVVTGSLIEGTITPKLLERTALGLTERQRQATGPLPTSHDMGAAIATAILDQSLPTGHTVVVGELG